MLNTGNLVGALDTLAHLDRELSLAFEYADSLPIHTSTAQHTAADLRRSLERSVIGTRDLRERLRAVADDASEQSQEIPLHEPTAGGVPRLLHALELPTTC